MAWRDAIDGPAREGLRMLLPILAAPLHVNGLSRRGCSDLPIGSLGYVWSFPLTSKVPSTLRSPVIFWESFHSSQNPFTHYSRSSATIPGCSWQGKQSPAGKACHLALELKPVRSAQSRSERETHLDSRNMVRRMAPKGCFGEWDEPQIEPKSKYIDAQCLPVGIWAERLDQFLKCFPPAGAVL